MCVPCCIFDVCAVCFITLKKQSFSQLSLIPACTGMICDITTSLEPIGFQYTTIASVTWKPEASTSQTLKSDSSVKQDANSFTFYNIISNINTESLYININVFMESGFFNEGEKVDF